MHEIIAPPSFGAPRIDSVGLIIYRHIEVSSLEDAEMLGRDRIAGAIVAFLIVTTSGICASSAYSARPCTGVTVKNAGGSAEDYPYPISLRINLVVIVKRALIRSGEYTYETLDNMNTVYTDRLADAVAAAEVDLGMEPTGCLSMPLVDHYRRAGR